MSANDPLARPLSAWLHEEAAYNVPDHLAEVLRQTAATRQRPAWSSLERWLPLDTTVRPHLVMLPRLGRVLLVAALIIALAALALVAAGSYRRLPEPFGLAANGEIAYGADGDILVADPDGTHAHAVVSGPSTDFAAAYTRDGTGLMFLRAVSPHEATLMIAAPDGSGIRPILKEPLTDVTWFDPSPDGRSLAVAHAANGVGVLSIVDIEHGTMRTLDVNGLIVDYWVYWLPGTTSELLFGSHAGAGDATVADIFSIQADGSGLTPVVPSVMGPAEYNGVDVAPDGRTLTYWRWERWKGSRIHQLDLATRNDRELQFDPSATGETGLLHSPDGSLALLQREDTVGQIMIAPADASRPGILVGRRFDLDAQPAYGFSPDGKTVYVALADDVPQFFDATTGAVRAGPATKSECCGWQRLAP